jgi:hypothetical protein
MRRGGDNVPPEVERTPLLTGARVVMTYGKSAKGDHSANQDRWEHQPTTHPTKKPASSLPTTIRRRWSASSSFVLARSCLTGCGRSNWTPPTLTTADASYQETPSNSSQPTARNRTDHAGHRTTPLTHPAPMGAPTVTG